MPCLPVIIALLFPRILIVFLWFFTNWFDGVYTGFILPLLGLIFLPFTTLWYSVVVNYYNGEWNLISVIGMVIAVLVDIGSIGSGARRRR